MLTSITLYRKLVIIGEINTRVMDMQLSERFIMAYNRVDRQLQKRSGIEGYMGFSQLVRRIARSDALFAEFEDDLLEFAELRNAIVHELVEPARVIAEPHISTVERLEEIAETLERPPLIIPLFQRQVYAVKSQDTIVPVLHMIRKYGYTQFPVYDGQTEFVGLLTDRCLANWLTFQFENLGKGLQSVTVAEVMAYDKAAGNNVVFLPQSATIFHAYQAFEGHVATDYPRLEAILITATGRSTERLKGIITPWDMFRLRPANS